MNAPSPFNYSPTSHTFDHCGKTFGKITAKPLPQGAIGPGPNSGTGQLPKINELAYSMAVPLEDINFKKQVYKPGPGQYSPTLAHSNSSPRVLMPKEMGRGDKKAEKELSYKPGVGHY